MEQRAAAFPARSRRRALIVIVPGLVAFIAITVATLTAHRWHSEWQTDGWARPSLAVHLAAAATAVLAGAWMVWRRPANRCGPVAMLLGVVFAAWWFTFFRELQHGWWLVASVALVTALRPLLFWLVLAFPIGRLDRASRRVFAVLVVGAAAVFVASLLTKTDNTDYPKVLGRWSEAGWTWLVISAWWDVGALFAAAAVLVVVQRRRLRFRTLGDHIGATAWWAAAVATGADFVLMGQGPLRGLQNHGDGVTPYGMVIQVIDLARWGLVVALLAYAARKAWPGVAAVGDTSAPEVIEIDEAGIDDSLRDALARALGDPRADVAVRDAGSGWLDLAGRPRPEPGTGRAVTIVAHDGDPVAALEYDDELEIHPAVVDAAVAALALQLESARQLALARNREAELRRLGRDVLDAEDRARAQLERDLHDGAQQALIGLSLQAALFARADGGTPAEAAEVADATDEVATMLLTIATGRPPALLAERGLDGALGALVLTAGVPVTVEIDRCDDLPVEMQRAVWFTTSEAVTNALKHARASRLQVTLRRTTTDVSVTIADNGHGGVGTPPASLSRRVANGGGALHIESNGTGTLVSATFPLLAGVTT
jgi:signal transduction histidine kinase